MSLARAKPGNVEGALQGLPVLVTRSSVCKAGAGSTEMVAGIAVPIKLEFEKRSWEVSDDASLTAKETEV